MTAAFRRTSVASAGIARALGAAAALVLSACATAPADPVTDGLDPQTATTVTVLGAPVELVADKVRGGAGDPFAYVAPFETDQMGQRTLYVWISAPQNSGPLLEPRLFCDSQPVDLKPVSGDLAQFRLSRPPYALPAPWSAQWYFLLSHEALQCLGSAQGIAVEAQSAQGDPVRYTASGKTLSALQAFARR